MDNDGLLNQFEKQIYNTFLRISRTQKKLPYKSRKDFSKLSETNFLYIKKIAIFLTKFKHIKCEEYFLAPFIVYPDTDFFELQYFTTLKAVKAYNLYQQQLLYMDVDNTIQLSNIQMSLKFIEQFCYKNQITLNNYLSFQAEQLPAYIIHLKEHNVNVFTLLGFSQFFSELRKIDYEMQKFILGKEFVDNIDNFRVKLLNSKKAKQLVALGLNKIEKNIENKLQLKVANL